MKPAEVRKQIKSGKTEPLYLLAGDDLQARHDLAAEFTALVEEGLEAFNVQSFYANEATTAGARDQLIGTLLSTVRTLPMMSPRRVVIVHEAEKLLSPRKAKDEDDERPAGGAEAGSRKKQRTLSPVEELEQYFAAPEPFTTLVFVAGELDANRRLVKLLRKHAVAVDCGSLDSAQDAAKWIDKRLEKDELKIEPQAVSLLLETTGLSLGQIRAEVEKLVLYAAGESVITAKHIRDLMMPHAESSGHFALADAIAESNARTALRELTILLDDGMPAFMALGQIRVAAGRLRPDDRARAALDSVFRADLAIKSSEGEPRFVLERLIIELTGRAAR